MTHFKRTGILSLLIVVAALALGFSQIRAALNTGLSRWMARQEIHFDVPNRPLPLDAEVVVARDRVTICNRSASAWKDVTLRVTNRVSLNGRLFDLPLFGKVTKLGPNACTNVSNADLFSPGWKKIPAPQDVNIVRVEILTSVTGQGYFTKEEDLVNGAVR